MEKVKKATLTEDQRKVLQEAYSQGLHSFGLKEQQQHVEQLARTLNLTKKQVKNYITNKKRPRDTPATCAKKPALGSTAYSVFLKGQMRRDDPPESHQEKMATISEEWRAAKADPDVMAGLQKAAESEKKQDLSKLSPTAKLSMLKAIRKKMSNLVEQLVCLGADCLVTIVCDSDLLLAGTERGQDFLAHRPDIETAFVHYCSGNDDPRMGTELKDLRKRFQKMMNEKYTALKGEPKQFPYTAHKEGRVRVHGLPEGTTLKRVASLSRRDMEVMLDVSDSIFITETQGGQAPRKKHKAIADNEIQTAEGATSSNAPNASKGTGDEDVPRAEGATTSNVSEGAGDEDVSREMLALPANFYGVKKLLDRRTHRGKVQYLVKWDDGSENWQPSKNVAHLRKVMWSGKEGKGGKRKGRR